MVNHSEQKNSFIVILGNIMLCLAFALIISACGAHSDDNSSASTEAEEKAIEEINKQATELAADECDGTKAKTDSGVTNSVQDIFDFVSDNSTIDTSNLNANDVADQFCQSASEEGDNITAEPIFQDIIKKLIPF